MVLQVIGRIVNERKSESQTSNHDESRIRDEERDAYFVPDVRFLPADVLSCS